MEVPAGQVYVRGSFHCSASNVLEPMLHPASDPRTCLNYQAATLRDAPWPSVYDAWLPSVSLQVRVSAGSSKEKGFSSRFRVSILSRYDLSC